MNGRPELSSPNNAQFVRDTSLLKGVKSMGVKEKVLGMFDISNDQEEKNDLFDIKPPAWLDDDASGGSTPVVCKDDDDELVEEVEE